MQPSFLFINACRLWLLAAIAMTGEIALADAAQESAAAGTLTITNESAEPVTLALPLADDLPRQSVTVDLDGKKQTYEGVALATLLEHAKVKIGADARGPLVARYIVLTATDGYRVVLSISEVDPIITDQVILIADRRDKQPLPAGEAPLRLIVAGDKRPRRWIRKITTIEVRKAPEMSAQSAAP